MILMSRGAVEALEEQGYREGFKDAQREAEKVVQALQKHISELEGAIEPQQRTIHQLNKTVVEQRATIDNLRQALLQHVKETA